MEVATAVVQHCIFGASDTGRMLEKGLVLKKHFQHYAIHLPQGQWQCHTFWDQVKNLSFQSQVPIPKPTALVPVFTFCISAKTEAWKLDLCLNLGLTLCNEPVSKPIPRQYHP